MSRKTRNRPTSQATTTAPRTRKTADKTSRPGTVTELRPKLQTRRRTATGPYTTDQLTEARAALASAMVALPIPVLTWTVPTQNTSRRATAHLADDTVITHVADRNPVFTVDTPCRHGARHHTTIHTATGLTQARQTAATCDLQHTTNDLHQAITGGARPAPEDKPIKVNDLAEGLKRAQALKDDTEPLTLTDIAAGLEARTAADTEEPKEHPQP